MKNVIGYLHTHWDREWYREYDAFRFRLVEVFDDILNNLENNLIPCFYFDGQTSALEDYLELRPEKKDQIKKLISENKLDIGPFYCSADSFLVSGEMYLRNLSLGLKTSRIFGQKRFICYIADSFGHSEKIPFVLNHFGLDKLILWRGLGSLCADLSWSGINTAYLIQGYFQDYLSADIPFENKANGIKSYLDKISERSSDNILLPIGGDHLGLPLKVMEQVNKLNSVLKDYSIKLSSPFDYFDKVKVRKKVSGEFLDNSKNFILQGVYSSRPDIKKKNVICSYNLARISEPLQAISSFFFNTQNKQTDCDFVYKTLIKNHAHDSIYGCSTDKTNEDVLNRYKRVETMTEEIKESVKYSLSGKDLSVINLSNFEYSGCVEVKTDKKLPKWLRAKKINSEKAFPSELIYNTKYVPVTEDYTTINTYLVQVKNLLPFSAAKLTPDNISTDNNLKITENSIENKFIKAEINSGKLILTDKNSGNVYKNFLSLTDLGDDGDSYNFGALKGDKPVNGVLKSFKTSDKGLWGEINLNFEIKIPLNSALNKRSKRADKCKIVLTLKLFNNSKQLEFKVRWKNKSKNHILKLGLNLPKSITSTINEDLFGVVERKFVSGYDIYSLIPAKRGIEIKTNTSPLNKFVSAQGVTVITKGITEYEVNKNTLNLTLLRSTGIISNPKNSLRGTPAGPPIETPNLQMIGDNEREFAITFTSEPKEMFKETENFFKPVVSFCSNCHGTQFFDVDNKNILVYGIKHNEKGLIVRLVNITSQKQCSNIKTKHSIYETTPEEISFKKISSQLKFEPYEIKTIMLKK